MVKVKKIMETDANGIRRQIFPETELKAVIGLSEALLKISAGESTEGVRAYVDSECAKVLESAKTYARDLVNSESGGTGEIDDLPLATKYSPGIVMVGEGLNVAEDGLISVAVPTANNYTDADMLKLANLKNYTAGANISISPSGIISATGGGETGGVSQEYVDQKAEETLASAKEYTYSKGDIDAMIQPGLVFEKIGEV